MPQVRHCRLFLTSQPQQNNILWSGGSFFFFLCSFQAVHSWKKTQRPREVEEATELSPSLCVYRYVYICTYTHTQIYTYVYMCVYILYTYICVWVYTRIYTHTHTYIHIVFSPDRQTIQSVSVQQNEGRPRAKQCDTVGRSWTSVGKHHPTPSKKQTKHKNPPAALKPSNWCEPEL